MPTRVLRPNMSAARMVSLWLSFVICPRPVTKARPLSHSSSVGRASLTKACKWRTRASIGGGGHVRKDRFGEHGLILNDHGFLHLLCRARFDEAELIEPAEFRNM